MIVRLENTDCMDLMAEYPDKYFDLAVVDPPYGIGMGCGAGETRGDGKKKKDLYIPKHWDNTVPSKEYWQELFRVSINQIVWGGNYFTNRLFVSRGWIYWRKLIGGNYSDGELAWTSFDMILKEFTQRSEQGRIRIHPTQKPVKLYEWIYNNYAKHEFKVIDTHGGSMSSLIAAENYGLEEMVICEIDKDYFEAGKKRYENHISNIRIL